MKICGIIAEYNPFHSGHLYHINEAKKLSGAEYIVVIMSGDFIQRGGPACIDKYARCRMTLREGADLVLELPSMAATSSAETFASSAVSILASMGCIDALSFGCEDTDISLFERIAKVLNSEPEDYKLALQKYIRQGQNFPSARMNALSDYLPDDLSSESISDIIKKPNNILAIEYCRAILKYSQDIKAIPVKREGAGHNEKNASSGIASAMSIRESVLCGDLSAIDKYTPASSAAIIKEYLSGSAFLRADDFSQPLICSLLRAKGRLTEYCDINEDLAKRIEQALPYAGSVTELCEAIQSRNLTVTRIRRCLFHLLLDHKKELYEKWKEESFLGYVNVLGFKQSSEEIFSMISPDFREKIVTRPSMRSGLCGTAAEISENDIYSSEIYRAILRSKFNIKTKTVLSEPVIVLR